MQQGMHFASEAAAWGSYVATAQQMQSMWSHPLQMLAPDALGCSPPGLDAHLRAPGLRLAVDYQGLRDGVVAACYHREPPRIRGEAGGGPGAAGPSPQGGHASSC